MGITIGEILGRREDLSTFLVHLCRDRGSTTAQSALRSVISEHRLRAVTPMGWAKSQDAVDRVRQQSQRTVCFSETPLQHIYSLYADIEGRSIHLQPYGLALTKVVARRLGVNPVWYVDMTTRGGREWEEARALDQLRDRAVATGQFHVTPESKILPFFEQMGTWPTSRKEFWWEREWRHRGDLDLSSVWGKIIWLAPEGEHDALASEVRSTNGAVRPIVLDPSWGTEQIVARLCGLDHDDVSLFQATVRREDVDGVIRSASPVNSERAGIDDRAGP